MYSPNRKLYTVKTDNIAKLRLSEKKKVSTQNNAKIQ